MPPASSPPIAAAAIAAATLSRARLAAVPGSFCQPLTVLVAVLGVFPGVAGFGWAIRIGAPRSPVSSPARTSRERSSTSDRVGRQTAKASARAIRRLPQRARVAKSSNRSR